MHIAAGKKKVFCSRSCIPRERSLGKASDTDDSQCDLRRPNCARCLQAGIDCNVYERGRIFVHTDSSTINSKFQANLALPGRGGRASWSPSSIDPSHVLNTSEFEDGSRYDTAKPIKSRKLSSCIANGFLLPTTPYANRLPVDKPTNSINTLLAHPV